MDIKETEVGYIAGTPYVGAEVLMKAGPGGHRGAFTAWDIVAGKELWSIKEKFPVWSGALVTCRRCRFLRHHGRLVQSRERRYRRAAVAVQDILGDHRPSRRPGALRTGSSTSASTRASAAGPAPSSPATSILRMEPPALGFVNAMKDLPQATTKGGTLYVFAIP